MLSQKFTYNLYVVRKYFRFKQMMMEELGQSPVLRHQQHLINSNSNSVVNKDKLVNHQQLESWSTIELTGSWGETSDKVPMSTLYNTGNKSACSQIKILAI